MTPLQYWREIQNSFPKIMEATGHSRFFLTRAFLRSYRACHPDIFEFGFFRLYDYSAEGQSGFLSLHRCVELSNRLLASATKEEKECIAEKYRFNQVFRDFIRRDWLYLPDSTPDQIVSFVQRNPDFLAKASYSTQGKNIFRYHSADLDPEAFAAEYAGKPFLLEAFLRQHPALAELNPTSVNTVRLVTVQYKGRVLPLGACLRCGGKDAYVDNFHQGGVAYPVDMETGIVSGFGRHLTGDIVKIHPSTGKVVTGFRIPHWDELLRQAEAAALVLPNVGFIGWDIAITEEGVEFVEGNIDVPDPVVIQFDRINCYAQIKDFFASVDRKEGTP